NPCHGHAQLWHGFLTRACDHRLTKSFTRGPSRFPSRTSTSPSNGNSSLNFTGEFTVSENPSRSFRHAHSTTPLGVGTRPWAHARFPTFGAMRTFAYPGSSGCTPSTCCERKTTG